MFLARPAEHQNYFGVDDNLGPVAVSVRRERLDDGKDKDGMQHNYRVTFRTSQVTMTHQSVILHRLWSSIGTQPSIYNRSITKTHHASDHTFKKMFIHTNYIQSFPAFPGATESFLD